jgi:cyclase
MMKSVTEAPVISQVAPNVYAYIQPDGTWWINNAGFIVGHDGVTLIDTCATEARTRALLAAVKSVTDAPIRQVVNTHHHGDHTHGNYLTAPAVIIGHRICREALEATGINHYTRAFVQPDWGHLEFAAPTVTFESRIDVWTGNICAELHYIGGPAHTTNDVVAWLPEERVLYTGDLVFHGGTPFVVMGSISGTLKSLDRLRAFDATTVVPGHGPVCGPEVFDQIEAYIRFVQQIAADAHRNGTSAYDAAENADLGAFASLTDPERLVGNLHRALAELNGLPEGGPLDIGAAIADMVRMNNGELMRCCA